jgi:anti-anti-sigma regulatory factor
VRPIGVSTLLGESDLVRDFSVGALIEGDHASIDVLGVLDNTNAFVLESFLNASMNSGAIGLTMTLDELDFANPVGIQVIVQAARRLVSVDGQLVIRSSPPLSQQLAKVAGVSELVRLEVIGTPSYLGAENTTTLPTVSLASGGLGSKDKAMRLPPRPSSNDIVESMLRLLVEIARFSVGGADGVSVSLRRQGRLATIAASDQTISDMDSNQYLTGEGPCVDASIEGRLFQADSLVSELRWPLFTPKAKALGINSILSLPLMAKDQPVGSLNIYSRTPSSFTTKDRELASLFATEASAVLAVAGADLDTEQVSRQIGRSLRRRRTIGQAEGIIMDRRRISADDAYSELRELSQRTNQPLREIAEDLVLSTQELKFDEERKPTDGTPV